ncbi:hypothetical protein JCM3774_000087 [Rhodotorula dairenensis]
MQAGASHGRAGWGHGGGGTRRGGGRNDRGGSSGVLRTSTGHGAARAQPYGRPAASTSTGGANAGKWQHDLFKDDSDLYNPVLNVDAVRERMPGWNEPPSASLRPYGSHTPVAQPLIVTATGQVTTYDPYAAQTATAAPPAAASVSTGPAIGIKGTNAVAAKRQADIVRKQTQRERAEMLRKRKELEKQRQEKVKIAKEEELGFVVEVAGLVAGTSAEDVQTAFGAYGEIRFCFIVDPNASDLVARLTFTRHDDAAAACSKLDGAIADGRPLRVKQASRTPMPPALPAMPEAGPSASTPMLDLTGNSPTSAARRPAAPVVPASAPPPSKMYADRIEAAQAQVSATVPAHAPTSFSSMDIDMTDAASGTNARSHGGGARPGAPVSYVPNRVNSLAARLGPALISGSSQSGNRQGGGAGGGFGVPAHAPRQPAAATRAANGPNSSLMARLGVTTAPGRVQGQNGAATTTGRGAAAGPPGGGHQQQRGPRTAAGQAGAAALLARIG